MVCSNHLTETQSSHGQLILGRFESRRGESQSVKAEQDDDDDDDKRDSSHTHSKSAERATFQCAANENKQLAPSS